MRDLETLVVELQGLAASTGNWGLLDSLKTKKAFLANLLGTTAKEALIRWRSLSVPEMDAPSHFFFGWEKKNGQTKIVEPLSDIREWTITDPSEIKMFSVSYYKDRFRSDFTENPDLCNSFFKGLPQVADDANWKLEAQ